MSTIQPTQTPTPVPDHGTGWGLLFLFIYLYGVVSLLGVGTIVAYGLIQLDRQIPGAFQYLVGVVLFAAIGLAGFIVLVGATAGMYDVVAIVLLTVGLPLAFVMIRGRRRARSRLALMTRAGIAWSLPFLAGFGVVAFSGVQGRWISPLVAGVVAVLIVVAGTIIVDHQPVIAEITHPGE